MTDQLPPHSDEAEHGALGCILCEPASAGAMLAELKRTHFYDIRAQKVFTSLLRLHNMGRTPDTPTLVQHLNDRGELDAAGGLGFVVSLPDLTPSAANFPSFLATLRDKASRRSVLTIASRAIELAYDEGANADQVAREFSEFTGRIITSASTPREWFKFYTPGECQDYQPPPGFILVGDCHLVRGSVTVIGGAPGVGKSRAGTALALAGATGADWFGLKVHQRFKTAILQGENGRYRLKAEFVELDAATLNEYVRVSDRPDYGLAFDSPEFRNALAVWVGDFKPDVLVLDPWNGIVRDDQQRDYREAFENIFAVLPKGEQSPAIVIIAHTRKPKADDRKTGRGLLHELSGSHSLGSVPRCVFVMQAASDDETDKRVVWTCCKNNDGEPGQRTAWHRRNGLFAPCPDFDWQAFDSPAKDGKETITKADLDTLFDSGNRRLARKHAAKELEEQTGFKQAACYNALNKTGRFAEYLTEDDGLIIWTP